MRTNTRAIGGRAALCLLAAAARPLPAFLERLGPREPPQGFDKFSDLAKFTLAHREHQRSHYAQHLNEISLSPNYDGTRVAWDAYGDGEGEATVPAASPVLELLVAHRLAHAPRPERASPLESENRRKEREKKNEADRRILVMSLSTILELHFVLSGERLLDPRLPDREDGTDSAKNG